MVSVFSSGFRFSTTSSRITSSCLRTKTLLFCPGWFSTNGENLFLFFSMSCLASRKSFSLCFVAVMIRALFSFGKEIFRNLLHLCLHPGSSWCSMSFSIIIGLTVWHCISPSSLAHCSMNLDAKSCPHTWIEHAINNKQRTRFILLFFLCLFRLHLQERILFGCFAQALRHHL